MKDILKFYNENGYYIMRNLLTDNECLEIIEQLNEIKTDMKIPFTNIQWGYGNLIDSQLSEYIKKNNFVNNFCKTFYKNNFNYKHLYVHNKVKWVGPDVEWHQEAFNINSFYPSGINYNSEEIIDNFMQIYIPLQDQTLENGCLKIIPKSHKEGILKHYDTMNTHLNHKRSIIPDDLEKIYKKYGIINLDLKAGDAVFFNHLLAHSSSSNNGPFDRKAMVFLTYKNHFKINEQVVIEEEKYRKEFVKNSLLKKLNSVK